MTVLSQQPILGLCTHPDEGGRHMYIGGGLLGAIVLVLVILFVFGRI
jgi:hypothetical protein